MQSNGDVPPWHEITHDAITDGYGINISGTKSLDLKEETYRKMTSLAQFIVNNPNVENQKGVMSQMMEASDAFTDVDSLVGSVGELIPNEMMPQDGGSPQGGQGPIRTKLIRLLVEVRFRQILARWFPPMNYSYERRN